ncbi:MAG: hypothetical protein WCN98_11900 [Verrucomicrobiaceae bacterium]
MDRLGITTLRAEVEDDVRVAADAAVAARERLSQTGPSGPESCAFQLVRFFNIVEQMGLRIAKAFENHIDDDRGWHAELIHRLSITVPGVRPAVYPAAILPALRDLRGFRHIVTHAYDLELDSERLAIVLRHAESAASLLPGVVASFFDIVTVELMDHQP